MKNYVAVYRCELCGYTFNKEAIFGDATINYILNEGGAFSPLGATLPREIHDCPTKPRSLGVARCVGFEEVEGADNGEA